jgi:hypothetical protein
MQKIITTFLFLSILNICLSQRLEIIAKSILTFPAHNNGVTFLAPQTDTTAIQFVATFKATRQDTMTGAPDQYLLIKKNAQKAGANCIKLKEFSFDSSGSPTMVIDAYFGTPDVISTNNTYHEKNVVFVFFSERLKDEVFSLKVNNEKITLSAGTFLKLYLKEGEELKLNKGGFTGVTAKFKYKKDKDAIYLLFTGGGIGGGGAPAMGSVGISFNTGRVREMTEDYGQFLTQTLKRAPNVDVQQK